MLASAAAGRGRARERFIFRKFPGNSMLFNITDISSELSIAEAKAMTWPLLLIIAGVAAYCIFIFKFYRFLGSKDIFKLNLRQYKGFLGFLEDIVEVLLYICEYLIILPLFIFFWFIVIALMITALSKIGNAQSILLLAMGIVGATRVAAFYNEELSMDMAKLLPLVLLSVFIFDIGSISYEFFVSTVKQFPSLWETALYYLVFIFLLEVLLRIAYGIYCWRKHK
jgi:hypothetical protein